MREMDPIDVIRKDLLDFDKVDNYLLKLCKDIKESIEFLIIRNGENDV